MNGETDLKKQNNYISLSEASRLTGISRDYLNVLIRRGKLKADKEGKNWLTTTEWIAEYRTPREKNVIKIENEYLSLLDASKIIGTSQGYLNVAVRRGKLQAAKLGRNWFTTTEWLSEYKTPAGKLEQKDLSAEALAKAEKNELASLREASLAERLQRIESQFASLRNASSQELPIIKEPSTILSFKNKETSRKVSALVASQEIELPARKLESEEKVKILESARQRIRTIDSNNFQNVSKQLGIKRSLKYWPARKLSIASALTGLVLITSLGMATGIINFSRLAGSRTAGQFSRMAGQANIFSNFPDDVSQFSQWLAKPFSIFGPTSTNLTIQELESGKSKIAVQEEIINSINSLSQAEALDNQTIEEVQNIASATNEINSVSSSTSALIDSRLSLVETNLQQQNDLINSKLSLQKKTILGVIESMFNIATLVPTHPGSTVIVQGAPATLTTYSVSPQVNSGFDRLSASYLNLASNAIINGSLTVSSGAHLDSLFVTGDTSIANLSLSSITATGNASINGSLTVIGTTTLDGLIANGSLSIPGNTTLGNASTTNSTINNLWVTNGSITNGTITNGTITNASSTNATLTNLWGINGTVDNLTNINASSTNATLTNFWSANGNISNLTTANSSSTNSTLTNFWATNGTITNASTTYLTVSNNLWSNDGLFSGGLGVGLSTTTAGSIQTLNDVFVGRNLYVGGNSTVLGNSTVIGSSFTNTLTINASINSDLIPDANSVRDIGSTAKYWKNAYINTLTVNSISAASTTIGGTQSETFTINSDNATADSETETLIFFRGTVVPNALLTWNAATSSRRFEFNQTLYINNGSASTTNPTLTVQTIANQTANALQVIDNNSSNIFSINPVGGNTTMINASTTNLTVSGNIWGASTMFLADGTLSAPSLSFINDSDTGLYRPATNKMSFVTNSTVALTIDSQQYVGIGSAITSPQAQIDIGSTDIYNNTIVDEAIIRHNTSSTAGNGLGAGLSFWGQAAEGTNQQLARIAGVVEQATTTAATFGSGLSFWTTGIGGIQEKMRIDDSGNVGIGTAVPDEKLVVLGDSAAIKINTFSNPDTYNFKVQVNYNSNQAVSMYEASSEFLRYSNNGGGLSLIPFAGAGEGVAIKYNAAAVGLHESTGIGLIVNGNVGIASTSPSAVLSVNVSNATGVANALNITSATSSLLYVRSDGNVGIGTTAPAQLLEISKATAAYGQITETTGQGGTISALRLARTGGWSWEMANEGAVMKFRMTKDAYSTWDITPLVIDYNGNVGIGTTSPNNLLTLAAASTPALGFTTNTGLSGWTMGIDTADANKFKIASSTAVGTNTRLTIDGNGNVGIGTVAPGGKFDMLDGSLILSDSDVDTLLGGGAYSAMPTNAYGKLSILSGTGGGVELLGISDDGDVGTQIRGVLGAANPGDTYPAVVLRGDKRIQAGEVQALGNLETVLQIKNYTTNLLTILGNGNVGIGTTGPIYKLDIAGDRIRIISDDVYNSMLQMRTGSGGVPTGDSMSIGVTSAGHLVFIDNSGNKLATIQQSGNVGIGTTSPNSILSLYQASADVGLSFGDTNTTRFTMGTDYSDSSKFKIAGSSALGTSDLVTITTAGNVGIGTTTPNNLLTLAAASTPALGFTTNTGLSGWTMGIDTADANKFKIASSTAVGTNTRLTIDRNGNVGIGTTDPTNLLDVYQGNIRVLKDSGSQLILERRSSGNGAPYLQFNKARGSLSTPAIVESNDYVAYITMRGYDGANFQEAALIVGEVDGTPGSSDMPGRISFWTTPDGSATPQERVRINNQGNVGIGTTGPLNRLEVDDTIAYSSFPSDNRQLPLSLRNTDATNNNWVGIGFRGGSSSNVFATIATQLKDVSSETGDLVFGTTNAGTHTEKMRILANGNVGIGTTTPSYALDVASGVIRTSGSSGAWSTGAGIIINDTWVNSAARAWFIGGGQQAGGSLIFRVGENSGGFAQDPQAPGSTKIVFDSSGNVGIGTTTPNSKLNIYGGNLEIGAANANTTKKIVLSSGGTYGLWQLGHVSGDNEDFQLWQNGAGAVATFEYTGAVANSLYVKQGNVGIGTTTPNNLLTLAAASTPALGFTTNAGLSGWTMGVDTADANKFKIASSTSSLSTNTRLTISGSGYVGIGTSSPNYLLDVAGIINATSLYVNGAPYIGSQWTTSGTSIYYNTGNVGIASTSPLAKLSINVSNATGTEAGLNITSATSSLLYVRSDGNVGIGTTNPAYNLDVSGTAAFGSGDEAMRIDSNGYVGIGTSTPTTNLTISYPGLTGNVAVTNGWLCVDNDGGCVGGTAGTVYFVASATGASDVAENYYSTSSLEAGDIVMTSGGTNIEKATSTSRAIIGIISTKPGLLLGYDASAASSSYPVALSGRVPVKVSLENGPISVGDKITISSTPGIGAKATASTTSSTVGMALEPFNGWTHSTSSGQATYSQEGAVLVFVNLGQPNLMAKQGTGDLASMVTSNSDINMNGFALVNVKSIAGINNLWSIDENGNITAQKVETQALTIGGGAASGVTIYDRQTSAPTCIYIEGGVIKTSGGACGQTANTGSPATIVPAGDTIPPVGTTTPPTSTTTPPVVEEPPAATSTPPVEPPAATSTPPAIDTATSTPSTATTTP